MIQIPVCRFDPMTPHQQLVVRLCKPGSDIIDSLTPDKAHIWHMASKLCSEAGELMDAIGKCVIYNQPLDMENVIEELGDCCFYMEGIRQCLEICPETPINHNIKKLTKRYGEKYSDQAAKERKDKNADANPKAG